MHSLPLRVKAGLFALSLLLSASLAAQTVCNMSDATETYRKAVELYQKKLYGLAQAEFERSIDKSRAGQPGDLQRISAEYYILECAYEQWSAITEMLIKSFIEKYPQSERQNDARYLLAKYYFREGDYEKASAVFDAFEITALSNNDYQEYAFKKAYSLFVNNRPDEASSLFAIVKDGGSKYASVSTYYYSHIAYEQQRFVVALKGFESLRDDEVFSKLAPYYIMHIYHYQKSYDKVIQEGSTFMENVKGKRLPEVARIMGEAYYHKKQYAEALPYIEKFAETSPELTRFDKYLLGYIYYQNKNYPKAASMLEQLVVGEDSLAQSAYYYLADAFMQQGDKQNAGRAFLQASKMDFFPEIKEDALFSYAKLMFELNSGPFNDAIEALNMYLSAYPNSRRSDEVNKCLMQAYVYSKNYKAALASLQAIAKPDADALAAMQKVAYFRAVEFLQNQEYDEAMKTFDLSLTYGSYSDTFEALATYWKAETAYRKSDYELAQKLFNEALLSSGMRRHEEEYRIAHYSLGYSLFKQRKYAEAAAWFRKYIAFGGAPNAMLCDAHNRVGDCSFMQRSYEAAALSYQNVMQLALTDVDYAALQCGLCYGLLGNQDKKISLMNTVIAITPVSPYADYALYEKGRCYVQMQRYDEAVNVYLQLLSSHPTSLFYAKTLLELGLISVNKNDFRQALDYYKQTIKDFQGTAEARSALMGIKNIYVEMGDVDGYFKYVAELKDFVTVNPSVKDSMTFVVAERAYMSGSCEKSTDLFQKYLKEFSGGAFFLDANFYMGDCLYRQGKLEEALPHFVFIINNPQNSYTELALLGAARGAFELGSNAKAAEYYERLQRLASSKATLIESRLGKLRADYLIPDYPGVIADATALLSVDNLSQEIIREVRFKRAKAYEQQGNLDKALEDYTLVALDVKTKEGAEAKYKEIEALFNSGKLDEAEQEVFNLSKSGIAHQYWMAKSFIILGDVYVKRNDMFQAKATYESILDGYKVDNDGVIAEVARRIQRIMADEKQKEESAKPATPEDIALQ
ncbi:MAG: tetratricopeptide repeat protein [Prevotellaceae bacterium]|jgi:TolA-binding protein|nr:tetratricopeptide repeat protein [Prevotellaceae bacterium]